MIIRMSVICAALFAAWAALLAAWMAIDRATVTEINPLMHPVALIVAAALLGGLIGAGLGGLHKLFFRSI